MALLFTMFVVLLAVGIPAFASGATRRRMDRLTSGGLPARGLVLRVSSTGTDARYGARRYERRSVLMDVEIYGRAPYELSAMPLIPKQLVSRVLPGTFLDIRVDPANVNNIVVVGPGGIFFVE